MAARVADGAHWQALSPLLDELLDLTGPVRAERLQGLRAQNAPLADELAALLARLGELSDEGFLDTSALPPPAGMQGRQVGAYVLECELGRGGMGSVWLAHRADGRFQSVVAIKFMRTSLFGRGDAQRFRREGELLARLDHPHIARLLDAGISDAGGQPYLVLEHVQGQPIDQHCEQHGLSVGARVGLMLDVLGAVSHAHQRGVLHRDLKPSNILVTADGQAKLLDFGIGKLLADATADGAAPPTDITRNAGHVFTERYAAPEQLQGADVTTATDVYAIGVMLYVLLSGEHPTEPSGPAPLDRMRAVVETPPPRVSDAALRHGGAAAGRRRALRGDLDLIVAKALKKQPAERYASAAAMADDLRRWQARQPIAARPDSWLYRGQRYVLRHRAGVAAAGLAVAALLAGTAAALWQARAAQQQRAYAEGLVEFMLGDLKDKLTPLGRLNELQAIGDKALAYYAAQDTRGQDADTLSRRARALQLIGEMARQRMDTAQARRGLEQAAAITAELLAQAPRSLTRLHEHADSLDRLYELADQRGEVAAGIDNRYQHIELIKRQLALQPDKLALRVAAINSTRDLAHVLNRGGRSEEALTLLAQTDIDAAALTLPPAQQRELQQDGYFSLGLVLVALGRYPRAVDALEACLRVMAADPGIDAHAWKRRTRANVWRLLAVAQRGLGRLAQAEASARHAVDDFPLGPAAVASNPMLAEEAIKDRLELAQIQAARGEAEAARAVLAGAEAAAAALPPIDANRAEWHVRGRGVLLLLRAALRPEPAADLRDMQALAATFAPLESGGRVFSPLVRQVAIEVELALGDLLAANGQPAPARASWQRAAERAMPAAQAGAAMAIHQLAMAQWRLGEQAQARASVARLRAVDWRHPAFAELQRALAVPPR